MATRAFKKKSKPTIDRATAAKLYIDSYYSGLMQRRTELENRNQKFEEEVSRLSKDARRQKEKEFRDKQTALMRETRQKISIEDFESVALIGRGAFGEVRLVKKKDSKDLFAMKIMNKEFMIDKNQLAHARAERDAMVEHNYSGIVSLYFSFQDEDFLYFVMEFLPGGDLMNLLIREDTLSEDATRFYMAELILSVQHVHDHGYIHRDLKPDNILVDKDGHIKLSDFGLCTSSHESHLSSFYQTTVPKAFDNKKNGKATTRIKEKQFWKKFSKTKSYSTVGTSNYMSPEILMEKGYGKEVDWWSVGVIMYECLVGYAPFSCEDTAETCMMILAWKSSLEFPEEANLSKEAYDLIKKLICDSDHRIGYEEIVAHPFFKGVNWENIRNQPAPWKPELKSPYDCKYFEDFKEEDDDQDWLSRFKQSQEDKMNPILKGLDEKHLPFVGWTFKRYNNKEQKPSASSLFDLNISAPNPSGPTGPKDEKMRVSSSFDRLSISEDKTTVARKLSTSKKEPIKKKKEEKKTPKKKDKKRDSKR